MPPADAPCQGKDPIPGYQNKWPVNEIAGSCNGGRIESKLKCVPRDVRPLPGPGPAC